MMRDMQMGMMAQMAAHLGNNRGPAQGDSLQPDLPFDQAIRGGDSLTAGTTQLSHVPTFTQSTSHSSGPGPTTSSGIDDALRQLTSTFQRGQDHISPNDILMTILRTQGLFVIGIAHIVCTFSRPPAKHHSAANAMVLSVIYNPDNLSYLNSLPHKAKQFHH